MKDDTTPTKLSGLQLLSVKEVAKCLACSERHIYRLADVGKMPRPVKLGGLNRWLAKEIGEWISAGCPPVNKLGRG